MSGPLASTDLHVVLTNHHALLEHAMVEQLGPVAALITRTLGRNGPLSLRDVITATQQDPFLTAQLHADNTSRLLPLQGFSSGHGEAGPDTGSAAATAHDATRPATNGVASSSTSSSPLTGARAAPIMNPTAALVRTARSTPSNLFLDVPSGAAGAAASASQAAVIQALVQDGSLLTDAAVKEAMTRLVLHRVVRYDRAQHTYELMLGYAVLLRVLFPLVARLARRRFGPAGEAIVLALHRLAVLPSWSALLQVVESERGASHEVTRAGAALLRAGWVQFLPTADGEDNADEQASAMSGIGAATRRKRARDGAETADGLDGVGAEELERPCRLSLQAILGALYEDAVEAHMTQYYGSHLTMPSAIVAALIQRALPRGAHHHHRHSHHHSHSSGSVSGGGAHAQEPNVGEDGVVRELFHNADDLAHAAIRPGGFPPAPAPPAPSQNAITNDSAPHAPCMSPPLNVAEVAAGVVRALHPSSGHDAEHISSAHVHLTSEDDAALRRTLRRLCEHTPAAVRGPLVTTPPAPSLHAAPRYALLFDPTSDALKATACESVIFARHGVLGVRLWKLLTAYHALEDRTLAEECMSSQPKTREALHALMKDGLVTQREVPRNASQTSVWSAERVPRNFVFLWSTNMAQTVVPVVREQLAKSLHNALTRLAVEFSAGAMKDSVQSTLASGAASELAGLSHGQDGAPSTNVITAEALKNQRAVVGLQAVALALMQQLLVIDFF